MIKKDLVLCFIYFVIGFQSLSGAPVISSIFPTNGDIAGGNIVTISGSGFTGTTNVNFGLRPSAAFTVLSDTEISAIVPTGTVGHVDVTVAVMSQVSSLTPDDFYTYTTTGWRGIVSGTLPNQIDPFNTSTNTFISPIVIPSFSISCVIIPDGTRIYNADASVPSVTIIDAATMLVSGSISTSVGPGAFDIIVNPSGTRIYVSNNISGYVTVIDTLTDSVVTDILVQPNLGGLAITPDSSLLFVTNFTTGSVFVIDTVTNTIVTNILTGVSPGLTSITPDGQKAYVANLLSDTISVIDIASLMVVNTINLPIGSGPYGSVILPNGKTLYVADIYGDRVTVVDVLTDMIDTTIAFNAGTAPFWLVATPDSKTVYVINENTDDVTPLDVATNSHGVNFKGTAGDLKDIVMSPDPAPVADFTVSSLLAGVPTFFDASTSISPIGTISLYAWDFGDGNTLSTTSPFITHIYNSAENYNVSLTVTNSAGTSTAKVFSSRFMSNEGGSSATRGRFITVLPLPPINLKGIQNRNKFLTQTEYVNVLTWNAPVVGPAPVAYKIFRDPSLTNLIGIVSGNGPLEFFDHNRQKNKSYTYYIVSVSATGAMSAPTVITVNPKL